MLDLTNPNYGYIISFIAVTAFFFFAYKKRVKKAKTNRTNTKKIFVPYLHLDKKNNSSFVPPSYLGLFYSDMLIFAFHEKITLDTKTMSKEDILNLHKDNFGIYYYDITKVRIKRSNYEKHGPAIYTLYYAQPSLGEIKIQTNTKTIKFDIPITESIEHCKNIFEEHVPEKVVVK